MVGNFVLRQRVSGVVKCNLRPLNHWRFITSPNGTFAHYPFETALCCTSSKRCQPHKIRHHSLKSDVTQLLLISDSKSQNFMSEIFYDRRHIIFTSALECVLNIWAPSSKFVSSSIPSWQISTAHAQPFRGARDLGFCLKVPLDSLLLWASREGSGETAWMCRLAWTFAARDGDKYQICLTRSIYPFF